MSSWDAYEARMHAIGPSRRDAALKREYRFLTTKLPSNLSYQEVTIDSVSQNVAIINTDNLDEKYIYSMPGENITHGGLVEWEDNYWLVTERDAADEIYTRAKMIQCNYLLRWVDVDAKIHEQWCIIEDGTKYLTGQYEDRDFIVTRGDSRLGMTIAKNEHTTRMKRGCRFLIDDEDSELMLAYELTKPFKLGGVFNGAGVFKFVLQEVNTTDDDNQELRIADYYKYFPRSESDVTTSDTKIDPTYVNEDGKRVWL